MKKYSFLLNGKGVEKRYIALMVCFSDMFLNFRERINGLFISSFFSQDSGPQCPTDVTSLLNLGANLLQTVGCFGGFFSS